MKRYLFILVLSLMTVISFPINNSFAATEPLSEEVFQWVQATPRSSYYFNKDAMPDSLSLLLMRLPDDL